MASWKMEEVLDLTEGETADPHLAAGSRTRGVERVRRAKTLLAYRHPPSPVLRRSPVRNPVCTFM